MPGEKSIEIQKHKKAHIAGIVIYTAANIAIVLLARFISEQYKSEDFANSYSESSSPLIFLIIGWALINAAILSILPGNRNAKFVAFKQNILFIVILYFIPAIHILTQHKPRTREPGEYIGLAGLDFSPVVAVANIFRGIFIYITLSLVTSLFLWVLNNLFHRKPVQSNGKSQGQNTRNRYTPKP